jgi:hypothetical protein
MKIGVLAKIQCFNQKSVSMEDLEGSFMKRGGVLFFMKFVKSDKIVAINQDCSRLLLSRFWLYFSNFQ